METLNHSMEYNQKLEECIQYFKQRKVFDKLFLMYREKFRSLGHFGGTVSLSGLGREECRQLGGFFQKDFEEKNLVRISAASMEKALENSRFSGLNWTAVLEGYFQEELVGKKELKRRQDARRELFFSRIVSENDQSPGAVWLAKILRTKGEGYRLLTEQYRKNPDMLQETLLLLMGAVCELPFWNAGPCRGNMLMECCGELGEDAFLRGASSGEKTAYELIAVFAARTTKDPHFFDTGTVGEQLLAAFLRDCFGAGQTTDFRVEEKAELFWRAGLLRDELSNHVMVYGIGGIGEDGIVHEGILGFLKRQEPLQLTLMTLKRLIKVYPQKGNDVYIVENPAVFAKLTKNRPEAALLCGNGQIRLAALTLLELFDQKTHFFYGGDYDPEGLQIAQRLKERFGERMQLWKYHRDFYVKYRSDVEISEKSLKKLERIYAPELQDIKREMLLQKKAAYQEAMLEEYLKDT